MFVIARPPLSWVVFRKSPSEVFGEAFLRWFFGGTLGKEIARNEVTKVFFRTFVGKKRTAKHEVLWACEKRQHKGDNVHHIPFDTRVWLASCSGGTCEIPVKGPRPHSHSLQ